jgi:hypothetical protein
LFVEAFDKLLLTVDAEAKIPLGQVNSFSYSVTADQEKAIQASLEEWRLAGKVRRMWARDASIWTNEDEGKWLGWMQIAEDQLAHKEVFEQIQADVKAGGFTHVLLLGMGGSSLAPEVLKKSFGKIDGFPELHILDSTDPAQVLATEKKIDLKKTLFIVSSKSGSTLEPNVFKQYFYDKVGQRRQQVLHRHRSGIEGAADGGARQVPAHLRGRAVDRRTLVGAFEFRHGAGRGHGYRRSEVPGRSRNHGAPVLFVRADREEPGRHAGHHSRNHGEGRARQGDHRRVAGHSRSGSLARTVAGGIDRQSRQGSHPGGSGSAGLARFLREGSRVRLRAPGRRSGSGPGQSHRRHRRRRTSGGAHQLPQRVRAGSGNGPLGNRDLRSRVPSSASTPSISRTSKPARSRRAS